jgi:radical SAM superfamily enzyme YgiQ (UPF0313 family)
MKIALIAMSGIRAVDAELLRIGLTLPGFVERSKTIASLPSLGLLTLAGMTPPRHEVYYLESEQIKDVTPLPTGYDLVAISTFTAQAPEAYTLARRFRARGSQVVIGGLHVTTLPHEPVEHGASAIVGEGESVWLDVLRDAEAGQLKPIYDARRHQFNLADAPMPAFELLDIERYNRITVQTSRGCPWKCAFCASSILLTNQYKQKPIEKVLAEIDKVRKLWPRPFIEFADDNGFVNKAYWHALLPKLSQRRIKWFTETDLTLADDEALMRAARRAGCAEVLIGFESPVLAGLDGIELHRNWKLRQWPRYKDAIRRIQSHGIRVNACFVLGLDGHTPAVFDAVYDFVEDAAPFDVQITYQTPFPGTPLYHRLKREGRLTHDQEWHRYTLFDINYVPTPMTATELREGFFDLGQKLYSDSFTAYRRERFKQASRRGRGTRRVAAAIRHADVPSMLPGAVALSA